MTSLQTSLTVSYNPPLEREENQRGFNPWKVGRATRIHYALENGFSIGTTIFYRTGVTSEHLQDGWGTHIEHAKWFRIMLLSREKGFQREKTGQEMRRAVQDGRFSIFKCNQAPTDDQIFNICLKGVSRIVIVGLLKFQEKYQQEYLGLFLNPEK